MTDAIVHQFELPPAFDLGATFLWALTGAGLGVRKGFDFTGIFVMAFVSSVGGGLLRDGIFLNHGPPLSIQNHAYLPVIAAGAIVGTVLTVYARQRIRARPFQLFSDSVDALGLGAYACVGAQMSLMLGLGDAAAILIGVINAVGGGLLRDVLVNEVWLKPGQLQALVAVAGTSIFVALVRLTPIGATNAALVAIAITFVIRMLAIRYDWRTNALMPESLLEP